MSGKLIIQWLVTATVVVAVSELSKRFTLLGAFLASLPLTSLLAIIWLYLETGSRERIMNFSYDVLFLVIPSLLFFVVLPWGLKMGWNFYASLAAAMGATGLAYGIVSLAFKRIS